MTQAATRVENKSELIQALKLRQGFPRGSFSRMAAYALSKTRPSARVTVASGYLFEIRSIQPVPGKGTVALDVFVQDGQQMMCNVRK